MSKCIRSCIHSYIPKCASLCSWPLAYMKNLDLTSDLFRALVTTYKIWWSLIEKGKVYLHNQKVGKIGGVRIHKWNRWMGSAQKKLKLLVPNFWSFSQSKLSKSVKRLRKTVRKAFKSLAQKKLETAVLKTAGPQPKQYVFFLKLTDLHYDLSPVEYGLGSGDFFQCESNLFVVGELHRNLNPIQLG